MVGSVFEWTEDCVHENYDGAPTDGSAWRAANGGECTNRILRGGSWGSSPDDLRSANRFSLTTDSRLIDNGFRVGRTVITP